MQDEFYDSQEFLDSFKDGRPLNGRRLAGMRLKKNMSQRKLAELADLNHWQISQYETGAKKIDLKTANLLAAILNGDFRKLMTEENPNGK